MQWALVAVMALGLLRECEAFAAAPLTGQRISSLAGLNAVAQVRQHQRGKMLAGVIMAAKGGAKKKKKPATSFSGFGAMPDKFITRVPESDSEPCACQSGQTYGECCKPFHSGEKWPETPLQLMRSRYTGYAYRIPDWIIDTTHRSNSDWQSQRSKWFNELLGFCDGFEFVGLDIVDDVKGGEGEHYIEFVARMTAREKAPTDAPKGVKSTLRRVKYQAGTDRVGADFRERSKFIMEDGKWLYQGGDVNFDPQATLVAEDGTRLEPASPENKAADDAGPSGKTVKDYQAMVQDVKAQDTD